LVHLAYGTNPTKWSKESFPAAPSCTEPLLSPCWPTHARASAASPTGRARPSTSPERLRSRRERLTQTVGTRPRSSRFSNSPKSTAHRMTATCTSESYSLGLALICRACDCQTFLVRRMQSPAFLTITFVRWSSTCEDVRVAGEVAFVARFADPQPDVPISAD